MKKKTKIVNIILKEYYKDLGIIALIKRQIEILEWGLENGKQSPGNEKGKIQSKIKSLNRKIEEVQFKDCQVNLIVENIRKKNPKDCSILDMRFKKGYLNSKISLELHYNESTIWQKADDMYEYIYKCLDDESIIDAKIIQEKNH